MDIYSNYKKSSDLKIKKNKSAISLKNENSISTLPQTKSFLLQEKKSKSKIKLPKIFVEKNINYKNEIINKRRYSMINKDSNISNSIFQSQSPRLSPLSHPKVKSSLFISNDNINYNSKLSQKEYNDHNKNYIRSANKRFTSKIEKIIQRSISPNRNLKCKSIILDENKINLSKSPNHSINNYSSILTPDNSRKNFIFNFPTNIKFKCPGNFHHKLMQRNIDIYNNSKLNEYLELKQKEKMEELDKEKFREEHVSTGIYGPSNNLLSIIRARMERIRIDSEYQGAKPELKEMVKDEIMLAKLKLKIKPQKFVVGKQNIIRPLYERKFDKYRYLSSQNKISQLNRIGNVPIAVNDDEIMYNLYDEAYKAFKEKRHQVNDESMQKNYI